MEPRLKTNNWLLTLQYNYTRTTHSKIEDMRQWLQWLVIVFVQQPDDKVCVIKKYSLIN